MRLTISDCRPSRWSGTRTCRRRCGWRPWSCVSRPVRNSPTTTRSAPLFQSAAKMIKETMDKKFGSSWHVVIGEGFGFEITHEVKNLLYLYFGGTLAVCVWKCS
ncbi:dynein axonemal light chain 4 isoform X2 [Phyllostomus hastatus]|uniref:dynein axonemal light chain 4 isoform X2 n=1 Tax=Phyllostomus hastatus TaxID=9423 RepID=UPI001E681CC3|nr:dynein axonemal light chain 4 isoform X2 [Phyllostomus hastatus]